MSDEERGHSVAAPYPAPPPFYHSFTEENLKRLGDIREQRGLQRRAAEDTKAEETLNAWDVPSDLRYLVPPNPPGSSYRSFGDDYNTQRKLLSLQEQGVEQVYLTAADSPSMDGGASYYADRSAELKKITRSILLNFLELTDILSSNPEQASPKIEDLRVLFLNAHHLINECRPQQARELLISMMEKQLARKREEVQNVYKMRDQINGLIVNLATAPIPGDDILKKEIEVDTRSSNGTIQDGRVGDRDR